MINDQHWNTLQLTCCDVHLTPCRTLRIFPLHSGHFPDMTFLMAIAVISKTFGEVANEARDVWNLGKPAQVRPA